MKIQVGDPICWAKSAHMTPESVIEGIVTKVGKMYGEDVVWVDCNHEAEACLMIAFLFPVEARARLIAILKERQRLKAAYDESAALLYQLRNDYSIA